MTAPQRSQEWHQQRLNRVTGSVVGAILGLSPNKTRAEAMRLMVREAHGAPREDSAFVEGAIFGHGRANEANAILDFEISTGEIVSPAPFIPYSDWLGASPDGFVSDGKLLECKTPWGIRKHPKPIFKSINEQPHYFAQIQIQLLCAEKDSCWFYQWTPYGDQLALVNRDNDWLNVHLPILRQFHAHFLHERDNNAAQHLAPKRLVIDTPTAAKMVQEWDDLTEQAARVEERKKDLLAEMVAAAGGKDAEIGGRKLTKVEKAGSISYATVIKKLAPGADLEPFRGKPSEHWRLS